MWEVWWFVSISLDFWKLLWVLWHFKCTSWKKLRQLPTLLCSQPTLGTSIRSSTGISLQKHCFWDIFNNLEYSVAGKNIILNPYEFLYVFRPSFRVSSEPKQLYGRTHWCTIIFIIILTFGLSFWNLYWN